MKDTYATNTQNRITKQVKPMSPKDVKRVKQLDKKIYGQSSTKKK